MGHAVSLQSFLSSVGAGDVADFFRHIGRFLIDQVEPVVVEDMGITAPGKGRRIAVIVMGIIVGRRSDGQSLVFVAQVCFSQRIPVVFKVAEDEKLPVVWRADDIDTVFCIAGEDFQLRCIVDGNVIDSRMARLGNEIPVIESPQERMMAPRELVFVYAEQLLGQELLLDMIEMIECGLGSPAEGQGGIDMGTGPVQIFYQFRPVIDFFEGQRFYRCAGDNEAVVVLVPDFVKGVIIGIEVGGVGVAAHVGSGMTEIDLYLQGRITEETEVLEFRDFLERHEIQDQDAQGSDVLVEGFAAVNGRDSFFV